MPKVKDFIVNFGDVSFTGTTLNDDTVRESFKESMNNAIQKAYQEIWDGDLEKISNLPVESFLPLLVLRHVGSIAHTRNLTSKLFEYGFDPEMIYERYRPKSAKKDSMLKAIDSFFSEPEAGEDEHLFSMIIDENAFNSFILDFVLIDRSFSLRELLKMDERGKDMLT